jgi:hypothetical protein
MVHKELEDLYANLMVDRIDQHQTNHRITKI